MPDIDDERPLVKELLLKQERARRYRQRLFYRLYPDEDTVQADGSVIYARHKYAKHLEFFKAGASYMERAFMAANRCITPWTYLETGSGVVLSAEVLTSTNGYVTSMVDGHEETDQLQHGFLKCIEPAFRLVMDNGQFFDCTRKHQVLSVEGWIELDQLVSSASGLRLWHRREDYQANCEKGGYLGDQQLHSVAGIGLTLPPSQYGVQKRAPLIFELTDEVERKLQYIHACQQPDRLSTLDDLRRFVDLFSLFSGVSTSQSVLSQNGYSQEFPRFSIAVGDLLQSSAGLPHGQSLSFDQISTVLTERLGGPYTRSMTDAIRQASAQWCDAQGQGGSVLEFFRGEQHISMFYPSSHIPLIGGRSVVAIVPLGLQPIIDGTAKKSSNYKAAGVFHHNTGKSFSGAFEVSCHLTGQYPEWWEGRRFTRPVRCWAAGKTNESTRDTVQKNLLGEIKYEGSRTRVDGSGLIPGATIGDLTWKAGVQNLVDTAKIHHVSGGWSVLGFKSYQQGRGSFEGTAQHIILMDEEPPIEVYGECLIRIATTNGIMMLTFTPLEGMSQTVRQFMPTND